MKTSEKITYYTVGVDTGSDDDIYSKEELLWLAEQHAAEGSRLINEGAFYLNAQTGGMGYLYPMQMAQSHAQIASALTAIAAQK